MIEGTPEERAAKVEQAIRCALDKEGASLVRGSYQVVKPDGAVCGACALGSLALSVGVRLTERAFGSNRGPILRLVEEKLQPFLSRDEAVQLELGFERVAAGERESGATYGGIVADGASPFYQLGRRLSDDSEWVSDFRRRLADSTLRFF